MKTWDDWSDFEINLSVAKKLGFVVSGESHGHNAVEARGDDGYHAWFTIDYCNNWADIGPIIDKHGIRLTSVACPAGSGLVFCATDIDNYYDSGWQPSYCRAAAIVFLMMNGVKP